MMWLGEVLDARQEQVELTGWRRRWARVRGKPVRSTVTYIDRIRLTWMDEWDHPVGAGMRSGAAAGRYHGFPVYANASGQLHDKTRVIRPLRPTDGGPDTPISVRLS